VRSRCESLTGDLGRPVLGEEERKGGEEALTCGVTVPERERCAAEGRELPTGGSRLSEGEREGLAGSSWGIGRNWAGRGGWATGERGRLSGWRRKRAAAGLAFLFLFFFSFSN
jgi:hypothetical protein